MGNSFQVEVSESQEELERERFFFGGDGQELTKGFKRMAS